MEKWQRRLIDMAANIKPGERLVISMPRQYGHTAATRYIDMRHVPDTSFPRNPVTTTPSPDPTLPWASQIILRTEVGSTAHGTGLEGLEDYDELGVFIPPWEQWIGIPPAGSRTIVHRPGRAPDERSGPGDYDLTLHSAQKFASLATQGNPSVLMALYGPQRFATPLGVELRSIHTAFWSERARKAFLGYAKAQRERLLGIRGGRHTNRPELEVEHGYDTKYAMHMLRLGFQGIEYMWTCGISSPMPEHQRDLLLDVRHGNVKLEDVLRLAERNEARLALLKARPEPLYDPINEWLSHCYEHAKLTK